MKFSKASPAERAALVRMVAASADLIIQIGRQIKNPDVGSDGMIDATSAEFVDAIIGVQESEEGSRTGVAPVSDFAGDRLPCQWAKCGNPDTRTITLDCPDKTIVRHYCERHFQMAINVLEHVEGAPLSEASE